jgi:hypothetical protein
LQIEVDRIADQITLAESCLQSFEAQLVFLKEAFLEGWGNETIINGPNYREYVSVHAAIDDFPLVRAHLANKLEVAERALAEFERTLKE